MGTRQAEWVEKMMQSELITLGKNLQMYLDGEITESLLVKDEIDKQLILAVDRMWSEWTSRVSYAEAQASLISSSDLKEKILLELMSGPPPFSRLRSKKGLGLELDRYMHILRVGTAEEIESEIPDPMSMINQTQFKGKSTKVSTFVSRRGVPRRYDYIEPVFIGAW